MTDVLRNRLGFAKYAMLVLVLLAVIFSGANDSEAAKKKKRYDGRRTER